MIPGNINMTMSSCRVATGQGKSQGNVIFLQGQGILQIVKENFKYQGSQGIS